MREKEQSLEWSISNLTIHPTSKELGATKISHYSLMLLLAIGLSPIIK